MTTLELKTKLNSALEHLKTELAQIRTGRATTSLVEEIPVEAYDSKMKIKELGTITTPDSQMILITPWDKALIKEIAQAIIKSNLSLSPVPDSQSVKVPVPSLTEERRKEFAKLVTERVEAIKHTIRTIRQDAIKDVDTQFANKEITEDDKFSGKEEITEIVKEFTEKADELSEEKKQELMKV